MLRPATHQSGRHGARLRVEIAERDRARAMVERDRIRSSRRLTFEFLVEKC